MDRNRIEGCGCIVVVGCGLPLLGCPCLLLVVCVVLLGNGLVTVCVSGLCEVSSWCMLELWRQIGALCERNSDMSDRITARDCQRIADRIGELWSMDRKGGEWTREAGRTMPDRYAWPFLIVEEGSATYGRMWRVFLTGGAEYMSALYSPPMGDLASMSARELHGKLVAVLRTVEALRV